MARLILGAIIYASIDKTASKRLSRPFIAACGMKGICREDDRDIAGWVDCLRLEVKGNFIPDSISVRREYAVALLQEYGQYIEEKCKR